MLEFVADYSLFLLKIVTWVVAIFILVIGVTAIAVRAKQREKLKITSLNKKYQGYKDALQSEILAKKDWKKIFKNDQKLIKKAGTAKHRKPSRIFVLNFKGDIKASATQTLREEITAILGVAHEQDEVVVILESPGGLVHSYGLAASQLQRVRDRNIKLTVVVDKVAASGGYLMACVANRILAAPFAIIGSIGVIAQLPNFHRFLKKHNVDFEQIKAGEYKRTLTVFGENTSKDRQRFQDQVEETHELFKSFINKYRPSMELNALATGEYWYGTRALELGLIDEIITSDDYLLNASKDTDLYEIKYLSPQSKLEKFTAPIQNVWEKMSAFLYNRIVHL